MDRLQKKCVIVSAGLHLLLLLIVVICPAFVSSKRPQTLPEINFVPSFLVDAAVAGGGNPNARPPQVNPKPPEPTPAPPEQVFTAPPPRIQSRPEPEPAKPKEPEVKSDLESLEASKTARRRKPEVSTTPVVRRNNTQPNSTAKQTSDTDKESRLLADRKRKATLIGKMAAQLNKDLSGATSVEDDFGPGGGGPSYASYAAWVKTVYEQAWEVSGDIKNEQADIEVKVTIARDGTVLSSNITSPSGDVVADRSVRRALDKVRTIGRPFPEGIKEKERTYTITFSPRAKRGLA
jgi:TonB family protein